jgi:hypothetical protein
MSRSSLEERYTYYRRCQHVRPGGEQCKAPAMKGEALCYKHEQQEQAARSARSRREKFVLPPLRDLKTVQGSLGEVMKAIIENRIDDDYAGEILQELERASIALRGVSR